MLVLGVVVLFGALVLAACALASALFAMPVAVLASYAPPVFALLRRAPLRHRGWIQLGVFSGVWFLATVVFIVVAMSTLGGSARDGSITVFGGVDLLTWWIFVPAGCALVLGVLLEWAVRRGTRRLESVE